MKLLITIDVEEDNWGDYPERHPNVTNIRGLESLQALFDKYQAKPSYLVTYPVAVNPDSRAVLQDLLNGGNCEIGAHCHPWNTPPFEEKIGEHNSMLMNLPSELQYQKLKTLKTGIEDNFGIEVLSFRAGRWGYSESVASNLAKLGFRVDSSVMPYMNWSDSCGPNYSELSLERYWHSISALFPDTEDAPLIEIPASVGYLQADFAKANCYYQMIANNRFWDAQA